MDWGFVAWLALGLMAVQATVCTGLYGFRSAWRTSSTGRALLGLLVVVTLTLWGVWVLAIASIPGGIFAVLFIAGNVVMTWLLVLLVRAQRRDRQAP